MDKLDVWEEHADIALGIAKEEVQKRNLQSRMEDVVSEVKIEFFKLVEKYDEEKGELKTFIRYSLKQRVPQIVRKYMDDYGMTTRHNSTAQVVNAIKSRLRQELGREPKLWEVADEWDPTSGQAWFPDRLDSLPLGDFSLLDTESQVDGKLTKLQNFKRVKNAIPQNLHSKVESQGIDLDRILQLADDRADANAEAQFQVRQIRRAIQNRFEELNELQRQVFMLDTGYIPEMVDVSDEFRELAGNASKIEMAEYLEDLDSLVEDVTGVDYAFTTLRKCKLSEWLDEVYEFFRSDPVLTQAVA